jgi:hypothetical protein
MSETLLLDAALFQFRAAAASFAELQFPTTILANAIAAVAESLNASSVNDVAFALSDLEGAVDQLSARDAATLTPILAMLRDDVARLQAQTALPADVVAFVRAFEAKLRARRTTIERNLYRIEGAPEAPLPHPPEELRADALPIRDALAHAGFSTPALDALIDDPSSVVFQSLRDIADELEVIAPE